MSNQYLDALLEATAQAEKILILTHNDPDPDAIASAVALRHLLVNLQDAHVKNSQPVLAYCNISPEETSQSLLMGGDKK